ncbi:MAG: UPF0149 family protein [Chromatiales bacterium]|jgi:uncharacterized protein YgfB (UPF0149 family)|nr:UPF0149 family protein [Chromatiales bacterium]
MEITLLERALQRMGGQEGATESHGILCGLLCARGEVSLPQWLALLQAPGEDHDSDMTHADEQELVAGLYRKTVACLCGKEALLELLLPEDDEALGLRSEAMAQWCSGFLYGLAAGGIKDLTVLPDDVREIVADIAEISHADLENSGEEEENAYAELVEYLRAGVTLAFELLESERESAREAAPGQTLH